MSLSLESSKQVFADVITRPLRFGYIVNRAVEYKTLREVYQYNSSLWGGVYNVFIPTDGQSIRSDWLRTLILHDPDVIFLVGELDKEVALTVYELVSPMQMFLWTDDVIESLEKSRPTKVNSLTMDVILQGLASKKILLSKDDSDFRCIAANGEYTQIIETITGCWPSRIQQFAEKNLGATTLDLAPFDLNSYLETLDALNSLITPLGLTTEHLQPPAYNSFGFGSSRLIIGDGAYDDLFTYFSAQGLMYPSSIAYIPVKLLTETADYDRLAHWFGTKLRGNAFQIVSHTVEMQKLVEIRDQLKRYLPHRAGNQGEGWVINISKCNVNMLFPEVVHLKQQQQISINSGSFTFSFTKPTFLENSGSSLFRNLRWINDVDLSPYGTKSGFAPSIFFDLNLILSGLPDQYRHLISDLGAHIRIGRGKLTSIGSLGKDLFHIQLPDDQTLIKAACESAGYKFAPNSRSHYQGLMSLLGDLKKTSFLREPLVRELFSLEEMADGRALTPRKMMNRLKVSPKELNEWLGVLSRDLVLLRGYNLECKTCGLETWYELSRVNEHTICEGCRTSFQIPIELHFAYRLNQLFMAKQSQGASTVLLTLLLLEASITDDLIWQADVKLVQNNQEIEVDILAMCDGCFVVVECKNSFIRPRGEGQSDISWIEQRDADILKLKGQLKREIALAEKLNAHLFFVATLEPNIPEEIRDFITEQNKNHDRIGIHLVADELIKGKFIDPENTDRHVTIRSFAEHYMLPRYYDGTDCSVRDTNANQIPMIF